MDSTAATSPQRARPPLGGVQRFVLIAALVLLAVAMAALPFTWAGAVVAVLGSILLAVLSPVLAIALALAAIPLELFVFDLGPVGLAPVQIAIMLAVVLLLIETLARGRLVTAKTPLDAWIFLWLGTLAIGAVAAYDPMATIKKAGMALFFAAFYYLIVSKVRDVQTISMLVKVFVAASAVMGGYGVWLSYRFLSVGATAGKALTVGSEGLDVPRAGSTLGNPTLLAGLMVVALPLAVTLIYETKGPWRLFSLGATATILFALGFTFTRGAWIGGVGALAILSLDKRVRGFVIALAFLVIMFSPDIVFERAASSVNTGRFEISHRFDFWNGAMLVAEKYPVFGAGLDNFRYAYSRLDVPETALRWAVHPHNVALDLLAETGIVGLFAFGTMAVAAFVLLMRRRRSDPDPSSRRWRLAVAAVIFGTALHQMTDSLLLEPTWNIVMWTMLAFAVVLSRPQTTPQPATDAVEASP